MIQAAIPKRKVDFSRPWNRAYTFCGSPRVAPPTVHTKKSEADKVMGDEIAYFEMNTLKTHVHYPNLVSRIGKGYLEPIFKHELTHHKVCPHDLQTLLLLIDHADRVVHNIEKAKTIENLFADMVGNTAAVKKRDTSIPKLYKKMSKGRENDKFWNVYMRSYEKLWNVQGLAANVNEKMEADAEKLDDIIKKSLGSADKWPETVEDFARVIGKYMQSGSKSQNKNKGGGSQCNNQKGSVEKSLVDKHKAKDFVPCKVKKSGKLGEDDTSKQIKAYAQKTNAKQFKRVVKGTGLGSNETANKWLYISLAEKYKIDPPRRKGTGYSYQTYDRWGPGHSIDSLDIPRSISKGGILLPEITTERRLGKTGKENKNQGYPDLLLVLDSSASMPSPLSYLSIPVLSCMAVAHSALDYGKNVAVINFSDSEKTCPYTINRNKIDDTIMTYINGGTLIPGKAMLDVVQSNKDHQHIIIISDTCIYDLENEIGYLRKAIKKAGGGTIFLFGNRSKDTEKLESAGYDVKNITTENDLLDMTRNLSWKLYGGKNA